MAGRLELRDVNAAAEQIAARVPTWSQAILLEALEGVAQEQATAGE